MPAKTANKTKGTTTRITVKGKKSEKVQHLQAYRAGDAKRKEGDKEKGAALKLLLTVTVHGEQVTDPADGTTWSMVNEGYQSEPKASAWDALLAGSILTPAAREKALALYEALREDKTRKNCTQV